mmetsp:Transcript_42481/g.74491  ORF Transcript_42481/g.74491 Transcript_42481/m.74491 type:complete len:205 (+) Transcript_42481:703-1317(+)
MPTRNPSAPASKSGLAWRGVTTLPQTMSIVGNSYFTFFTKSTCCGVSPCDALRTNASTPASISLLARSYSDGTGVTAAATRSCLLASFDAFGYFRFFFKSLRLTMATSSPASFTIGSLPFLLERSFASASVNEMGSCPSTILALGVITSASLVFRFSMKSMSRLVTMPMSLLPMTPCSQMRTVDTSYSSLIISISSTLLSGPST